MPLEYEPELTYGLINNVTKIVRLGAFDPARLVDEKVGLDRIPDRQALDSKRAGAPLGYRLGVCRHGHANWEQNRRHAQHR
jgi:hypothetical protein